MPKGERLCVAIEHGPLYLNLSFLLDSQSPNVTVQWWRNDSFGTDCRCRIGSESCKHIATCNMPPFYLWTCNNPCNIIFLFRKKSLLVFLTSFSVVIRVIITSYFLKLWITSSCVRTALLCEIILVTLLLFGQSMKYLNAETRKPETNILAWACREKQSLICSYGARTPTATWTCFKILIKIIIY